ncbi:MAG: NfeD family protein [Chitinophagales bacterium]|nr:NfeD family protein [Chitinophagales bacterium]
MNIINEFWSHLVIFEKILFVIAIIATLLFLLQTIMIFLGGDIDDASAFGDADEAIGHDDGVDSQYLTLKNLIAFFTMFGWIGLACFKNGMSYLPTIIIASIAGVTMVAIMMFLFKSISKLKYDGTLKLDKAIGKKGTVYLTIPANNNGLGKINIKINNALLELDAITNDKKDIANGTLVEVIEIVGNNTLLVSKIN